jgi:hypothetical protein
MGQLNRPLLSSLFVRLNFYTPLADDGVIHFGIQSLQINLSGIVVLVGNYGSGKTEICINLAVNRRNAGLDVRIADLDLVNPYFRTREAREPLSKLGIEMVLPPEQYLKADLPILSPRVAGMIQSPSQLTILDAGGDDVGATVLATLADSFANKNVRMLQVFNPARPFTDTVEGCLKIKTEIERASKMTINGIIGNPNLIEETTAADIYSGYEFGLALSDESGLPLEFITVETDLWPEIDMSRFTCPVLPIYRQLVPPWKKAVRFSE